MNDLLSVVVPCFNEEEVLSTAHTRLAGALNAIGLPWEILYVDDGSHDRTREILMGLSSDQRVKVLSLSRNFGHQAAVTAGLQHAGGDAVAIIDADLQDPPEVIGEMVKKWREGYDVAYGMRTVREGESVFKLWTARAFYRLINRLSDVPIPLDVGDFRLLSRRAVDAFNSMPECDRFIRGMVAWVGFRQIAVPYVRERRRAGTSKYPLRKMLRFAWDGILSFSDVPARLATVVGFVVLVFAILVSLQVFIAFFFTNDRVPGWTSTFLAILFLGGVQSLCIGVLGQYIARIYREVKKRPLYLVAATANLSGPCADTTRYTSPVCSRPTREDSEQVRR